MASSPSVYTLFEEVITPEQKRVLDALVWCLTNISKQCFATLALEKWYYQFVRTYHQI
jgi:hypothetical protein